MADEKDFPFKDIPVSKGFPAVERILGARRNKPQPTKEELEKDQILTVLIVKSRPLLTSNKDKSKRKPISLLPEHLEVEALIEALEQSDASIAAFLLPHATRESLSDAIRQLHPKVIHFDGHGREDGSLCFENEAGLEKPLFFSDLAGIVKDRGVELLVLSACDSSKGVPEDMKDIGIPSVITMNEPVRMDTAKTFLREFYAELGQGETLEDSFEHGIEVINIDINDPDDAKIPNLISTKKSSRLVKRGKQSGFNFHQVGVSSNLENQHSIFVGREAFLVDIIEALEEHSVITLHGPPGVGKTALAKTIGQWHSNRGKFSHIFFAGLETTSEWRHLVREIAKSLGNLRLPPVDLSQIGDESEKQRLEIETYVDFFASAFESMLTQAAQNSDLKFLFPDLQILLILDNFENLLDDANAVPSARILRGLLDRVKNLKILTTSRKPLALAGENVIPIDPLLRDESLQLFFSQAGDAWKPRNKEDVERVAKLCEQVSYLPLAVELLVPHVIRRGLKEVEESFKDYKSRLELLKSNRPDLIEKMGDIALSMELTYEKLDDESKKLFWLLAFLEGGIFESDLDKIWGNKYWNRHNGPMDALIDWAFVKAKSFGEVRRFDLLRVIRDFGLVNTKHEKIGLLLETAAKEFSRIIASVASNVGSNQAEAALRLFELELPNIRVLLGWCKLNKHYQLVLDLTSGIAEPLYILGFWQDAIKWLDLGIKSSEKLGSDIGHAAMLDCAGIFKMSTGEYDKAKKLFEQSLEIRKRLGDQSGISASLHQLGMIHQNQGEYEEAKKLYNQSLEIRKRLGDQSGILASLHNLGMIHQDKREYEDAKKLFEQSLEIKRRLGDQSGISKSLHHLGMIHQDKREYEEARELFEQSLEIKKRLGDQAGISISLHHLGMIHQDKREYEEAKKLFSLSLEIAKRLGNLGGIASSLGQIGQIAFESGDYADSIKAFQIIFSIFRKLRSPFEDLAKADLARLREKVGQEEFDRLSVQVRDEVEKELRALGIVKD
ncbi:tetratricopeptide repeat protein [Candidatus Acetothermia bacterium]|nr:tetratricopeptide repeat protein [Candidatus Acetothermia bacterium]